jgi:arylsulfatase A-like enzyme
LGSRLTAAFPGLALALLLAGCPSSPKQVVYDLAERTPVAERWSEREVILFGTPSSAPFLGGGFHREARIDTEAFAWSKAEAEVLLPFDRAVARAAVVDLASYDGVEDQDAEVFLNGIPVGEFRLGRQRSRHYLSLPPETQQPGENRLRFVFAQAAIPMERDPESRDRRQLAAAFYSLTVGLEADPGLQDLLRREAPRPFAVTVDEGVPVLSLVGPSAVRFALRLPGAAELRFEPELPVAARAAAGGAVFRATLEREGAAGEEELFRLELRGNEEGPGEVVVPLDGEQGEIVGVGLRVEALEGRGFAWGTWRAPRILGRGGGDPLETAPLAPAQDALADGIRRGLKDANVVLVILDAARARQFGAYGYERDTTPVIDAIAADGIVFENVYTPAVYTLGAMSSVWTSQYPDRHHGDVSFQSPLPPDRLTLAEVLSGQGIRTAGFTATAVSGSFNGFDRGFDEFEDVWQTVGSRADAFREVLPGWIEAHAGERFFLYVHYREPHFPYDPEPPFDTKFGPDGPIPKVARRDMSFFREINQGRQPFSEEEQAHLVRLYDGNLGYVDREVGKLQRALQDAGVWDRTVFMVSADHGEGLWEHGWIGHNVQVYEPSAHIPLIIRLPEGVGPRGVRVGELADMVDFAPTVADVFGARAAGGADREFMGRSLLPVIAGAPGRPAVVSRTVWETPRYALRDGVWTYIYDTATGAEELFDTRSDPDEQSDVAGAHPLRTAWFRQTLLHWVSSVFRPGAAGTAEVSMSRDECEALKALGYLSGDVECPPE